MSWLDFTRPDLAPEAVLGLLAIGLALMDALLWPRRPSRAPSFVTLFGLLLALALALESLDLASLDREHWLFADAATAFADVVLFIDAVLAALLATAAQADRLRAGAGVLLTLATLGGLLAVSARDLALLFAGLELSALSLVAYQALGQEDARKAARGYLGPAGAAGALSLLGIACLWSAAGDASWETLSSAVALGVPRLALTGAALLMAGLAVRIGAVPFHLWQAEVAAGVAPAAVLLTLSVGILPALVVLGRLAGILATALPEIAAVLLVAAVLTVTVGNLLSLPQRRLRPLLGYLTVTHVGYLLASLVTDPVGLSAATWLLMAALVPAVGGCLAVCTLAGKDDTMAGLVRRVPAAGVALCLFLLTLAGLSPTIGFAARGALFAAVVPTVSGLAGAVLLANVLLTAWVCVRFAARVILEPPAAAQPAPATPEVVSVIVLAAAVLLLLGLWPVSLSEAVAAAVGI